MVSSLLCIGQSDSCAGTGLQADLKTAQALGAYAATVVTAVSVQDTQGVYASHTIPAILVYNQIQKIMDDIKPKVIKTGVLVNAEIIDMLGNMLDERDPSYDSLKLIVDPVMSRTGAELLDKEGRDAFKRRLLIHADVLLPNIAEAEVLSGIEIDNIDKMKHAAESLMTLGAKTVIIKGSKLSPDIIYSVLADEDGVEVYEHPRQETKALYGAGATLSTALAVKIGQGMDVRQAYEGAVEFVIKAMNAAEPVGAGYIPLNQRDAA